MENRIRPVWVIILLLSGLLIGLYINKGVGKRQVTFEGGSKFDEVMWYVDNDYVEKPDAQKLQDEAIAAMMEKLDPHSAFISLRDSPGIRFLDRASDGKDLGPGFGVLHRRRLDAHRLRQEKAQGYQC